MEKRKLPNATGVLVLGVLSIVSFCCYGIFGFIFAIIALILAHKDQKLYNENPEVYSNYANLTAGRIMAIVGLIFSAIMLAFTLYLLSMGEEGMQDFLDNLRVKVEQKQSEDY